MANPLIPQGTLNRLRGSVVFDSSTAPDITASYMGEEGINISFEGQAADTPNTMVGYATSPAPYLKAVVEIELNKAIGLADAFKRLLETNSVIGDFTVWPDSAALSNYVLTNGIILNCQPGRLNGKNVGMVLSLQGLYPINAALFS